MKIFDLSTGLFLGLVLSLLVAQAQCKDRKGSSEPQQQGSVLDVPSFKTLLATNQEFLESRAKAKTLARRNLASQNNKRRGYKKQRGTSSKHGHRQHHGLSPQIVEDCETNCYSYYYAPTYYYSYFSNNYYSPNYYYSFYYDNNWYYAPTYFYSYFADNYYAPTYFYSYFADNYYAPTYFYQYFYNYFYVYFGTDAPSGMPVYAPTGYPIAPPTVSPVANPTNAPFAAPSPAPVDTPTAAPVNGPTAAPVAVPTATPTATPSTVPSASPSRRPSTAPSALPVNNPTASPSRRPSTAPVALPTRTPSYRPTFAPTRKPTYVETDDDFDALHIDDDMTQAITPGDSAYYNVAGYVFYQFYTESTNEHVCGSGTPSYSTGYMSGTCIADEDQSFMVTFASASNCADLRVQWFADQHCSAASFLYADLLSTFTECRGYVEGSSLSTYVGGCSAGNDLPLARQSAVLTYYQDSSNPSAAECAGSGPVEYVAYSTNVCFANAAVYPNSMEVTCDANSYTQTEYFTTACSGASTVYGSGPNDVCAVAQYTQLEAAPFSRPTFDDDGSDDAYAAADDGLIVDDDGAYATPDVDQDGSGVIYLKATNKARGRMKAVPLKTRGKLRGSQAVFRVQGADDAYAATGDDAYAAGDDTPATGDDAYAAGDDTPATGDDAYAAGDDDNYYYAPQDDDAAVIIVTYSMSSCVNPVVTGHPSAAPTFVPGFVPTAGPSQSNVVAFSVTQVIDGIDSATYSSDPSYQTSLKESIAASMDDVTTDMISDPVVTDYVATSDVSKNKGWLLSVLHALGRTESASTQAISVYYQVTANIEGATYSSLSTQLENSVASGDFNSYLTQYGDENGAYGFAGCTSSPSTLSIHDEVKSNSAGESDAAELSGGEITGIVIGALAGVAAAVFCFSYFVGCSVLKDRSSESNIDTDLVGRASTKSTLSVKLDLDDVETDNPIFATGAKTPTGRLSQPAENDSNM